MLSELQEFVRTGDGFAFVLSMLFVTVFIWTLMIWFYTPKVFTVKFYNVEQTAKKDQAAKLRTT